jgi:hypothetical protein
MNTKEMREENQEEFLLEKQDDQILWRTGGKIVQMSYIEMQLNKTQGCV